MPKKIFTFWEPRSEVPGYIQLCLRTWKKYLSDHDIVVCDYSNIRDYLDDDVLSEILFRGMPLPKQADCIRCALLRRHGGIWLDADTIVTSASCFEWSQRSKVVMIGRTESPRKVHVAFISAATPNTKFINAWYSELPHRIARYRKFHQHMVPQILQRSEWRSMKRWDYCGNAIVNSIWPEFSTEEFLVIDRDDAGALPEWESRLNDGRPSYDLFRDFYLRKGDSKTEVLDKSKGLVLLHNSWMPDKYKQMTAEEFLQQDILLADVFRSLSQ